MIEATNESLRHKGRRYTIRTAADFKQLPPERLGLCLEAFQQWLLFFDWQQHRSQYRAKHPFLARFLPPPTPVFAWVDMGHASLNPMFR